MKERKQNKIEEKEQARIDGIATIKADLDATDAGSKFFAFFAKAYDDKNGVPHTRTTFFVHDFDERYEHCVHALAELALDLSNGRTDIAVKMLRAASTYAEMLAQERAEKRQ